MRRTFTILICVFLWHVGFSQLPITEVFMYDFIETGTELKLEKPVLISGFNLEGYNNQPSFVSATMLYLTTNSESKDTTDIVLLDLGLRNYQFITKTTGISEYSPMVMPDKEFFSVVRQEGSNQWLWKYPTNKSNGGESLLSINDVGYYCWLNQEEVALFRVTDPVTLSIANIKTGKISDKLNDIGRCLKLDSEGNLIFVHKVTSDFWFIKSYNPKTENIKIITETDSEDFVLLSSGTILKGKGSKLYKMNSTDKNWKEVGDFLKDGLQNISRLTSYRNKLIVVSTKK